MRRLAVICRFSGVNSSVDVRQFGSDHNVIFENLIIGLVKLQVLENWLKVYAGKNLLHSITWRACKYQNMDLGFWFWHE